MTADRLKVLVLDQGKGVWGAQKYLLRLAPLLRERGIDLVLGGPRFLELHEQWRRSGLSAVHLDLPVERSVRRGDRPSAVALVREAMASWRTVRDIARIVRDGDFDCLWANSHWTHLDAALAGRRAGCPVVLHLHEEAMPGFGTWLRAVAVRIATRTVAVSRAVADGLPVMTTDRIDIIANGVDTDAMSPRRGTAESDALRAALGVARGEVLALAATRIDPSKRIEDLVEAVVTLANPKLKLVVAGATSGYPDYERRVRADAENRAPGVVFCGARDDIANLLRAADVFLHTGLIEGMPLGILEAQACGVPVVAYRVAGVPEAVSDGVTGFLVPAGDVAALSRSLGAAIDQPDLRQKVGGAARRNAVAHHDIRLQADRNADVIAGLCRRIPEKVR